MIVVDASVAVKWLIPETGEEAAKQLLADRQSLVAPALIRLEVTAAVLRAFRENRLGQADARAVIGEWHQMLQDGIVHLIPDDELYPSAVEIGFKSRHALQDCLYLATALTMKAQLITADRTMVERGSKSVGPVTLLKGV